MNKKKWIRTLCFVLIPALLFLILPLPIKFPDMDGVLHVLWVNGILALKIGGLKSLAIGLVTFSSAGFLASKINFGDKE